MGYNTVGRGIMRLGRLHNHNMSRSNLEVLISDVKNRTDMVISNTGTADAKIMRVYIGTYSGNIIDVTAS